MTDSTQTKQPKNQQDNKGPQSVGEILANQVMDNAALVNNPPKVIDVKPGPESSLTEELCLEIRKLVLEGTEYTEIREKLKISKGNWDWWYWKDYQAFRENLTKWQHERLVAIARGNLEELLTMPVTILEHYSSRGEEEDEKPQGYVTTDPALVRVKADATKFALERLDKPNFASRNELTGDKGKDLIPVDPEAKKKADSVIADYLKTNETKNLPKKEGAQAQTGS